MYGEFASANGISGHCYFKSLNLTKWVGVMVMLWTCISEVLVLNLGWVIDPPK